MTIEAAIEPIPAVLTVDDPGRPLSVLTGTGVDYAAAKYAAAKADVLGQLPDGHRIISLTVPGRATRV